MGNFRYGTKREFLQGAKRWSGAAAGLAVTGEIVTASAPAPAQWANVAWVNHYGGGGWNNRGSAWANRGSAWANRGGWVNGSGGWVNRGGSWLNGSGGAWINRYGGGGIGWVNR